MPVRSDTAASSRTRAGRTSRLSCRRILATGGTVDLFLRGLEQRIAFPCERFAFFEQLRCSLQVDAARLELFDDLVDSSQFGFERYLRRISHRRSPLPR